MKNCPNCKKELEKNSGYAGINLRDNADWFCPNCLNNAMKSNHPSDYVFYDSEVFEQ